MIIRYKPTSDKGACIIDDSKAYLFNFSGNFVKEEPNLSPKTINGVVNLPIISIISSNGNTDILVHKVDDTDKFYNSSLSAMDCASVVSQNDGLIRILRRTSKFENCRYNQIVFIFNESTNVEAIVNSLTVKEYENV